MSDDKENVINTESNHFMETIMTNQMMQQEDEQNELEEMHDHLLRSMEIQIEILKTDLNSKDAEIEILLEEINRHREATMVQFEEANELSRQFDKIIRGLHERNEELEADIEQLNHSAMKHLQIIERMEMEIERLRSENSKHLQQNKEYCSGNAKAQMNIPSADSQSLLSDFEKHKRFSARLTALDSLHQAPELSTDSSFFIDNLKSYESGVNTEELWFNQLENFKEQLENEKTKGRDLEFLVMGLKNSNQHLSAEVSKLCEEKKVLEFKYDVLKTEYDKVHEARMKDKLKIDSLISFCNLIENCNIAGEDLVHQLTHFPELIANYLNGKTSTLTFKKPTDYHVNSSKVIKNSKIRQIVKRSARSSEPNLQRIHKGISEVKETMTQMLHTMKQLGGKRNQYSDTFALKNIEVLEDQFPVSKPMTRTLKPDPPHSFFLSKALLHPQGLLWNLQKVNQVPNSGDETDESDLSDSSS